MPEPGLNLDKIIPVTAGGTALLVIMLNMLNRWFRDWLEIYKRKRNGGPPTKHEKVLEPQCAERMLNLKETMNLKFQHFENKLESQPNKIAREVVKQLSDRN